MKVHFIVNNLSSTMIDSKERDILVYSNWTMVEKA